MTKPGWPGPVANAVAEALARRAEAQQGEARQWMVERAEAWRAGFAKAPPVQPADEARPRRTALAALSALVDRLGRTPAAAAPRAASPGPAALPASSNAVTAYQATWSRLRAEQRLRQALAEVPAGAGPLHSTQLVARALQAMRELSPAYLDAFMAHVDTLLALEPGFGDAPSPARASAAPETTRRRSRS